MPVILVIDRTGSIKELSSKTYEEENLYKKAGFKTPNDFHMHHVFEVKMSEMNYRIRLYGKIKGKAGQENKYDFPPPIDNVLFFGSCLLVHVNEEGHALNLSSVEWKQIYEKLFGGFEDLGDNDTEDDELDLESEELIAELVRDRRSQQLTTNSSFGPSVQLTKEGYVKDNFIVDDDAEEEEEDTEEEESIEDEEEPSEEDSVVETKKRGKALVTKVAPKASKKSDKPVKPAKPTKLVKPAVKRATSGKSKRTVDTTYITSRSEEILDVLPILQDELEEEEYFK